MNQSQPLKEPLSVLLVDTDDNYRLRLSKSFQSRKHVVLTANNTARACSLLENACVDVIIINPTLPDVSLPCLIERLQNNTNMPGPAVIALSDDEREDLILDTLTAGADDFLIKPVSDALLHSKVQLLYELKQIQHKSHRHRLNLEALQRQADNQQFMAKHLFDQLLYANALNDPRLRHWLRPSEHFSGDLITAARMENDRLCVLLADSTGHGLTAALPTIIIAQAFHAMVEKGFTLPTITREINNSLHKLLPPEYFVAAVMCLFDFKHRTIECWNGGMPTAFFISHAGQKLQEFKSQHMPLGILSPNKFNSATSLYHWYDIGKTVIFSDGLAEAENQQREAFGYQQVLSVLEGQVRKDQSRMKMVQAALLEHIDEAQGHDDISLVTVDCR